MKKKAALLFSGGQDSTTALGWSLKNFDEIYLLSFDYGQKHLIEVNLAIDVSESGGVIEKSKSFPDISLKINKKFKKSKLSSTPDSKKSVSSFKSLITSLETLNSFSKISSIFFRENILNPQSTN